MKKLALLVATLILIVGACSSDSEGTTTTSESAAPTTVADAVSSTTTSTSAATTTTTTVAASGSDATECVIGSWELDTERFFTEVIEAGAAEGLDGEFSFVDGAYLLVVSADGSFQAIRDNWTFAVSSDFGDLQVAITDTDDGTWTLDGDVLSTVVVPGEPPEITFLVDGEPFTFPGGVTPFEPPQAEFTGATVSCDGDVLAATAEGFTSYWNRQ